MSIYTCLSVLELAAYKAGEDPDARTEQHLTNCLRCRALLAELPDLAEPEAERHDAPTRLPARPAAEPPNQLQTGQLWAATVDGDDDWRELIVVLATQPSVDGHELVLVAPVQTRLENATSTDIVVDDSPLGYEHLINVGLQGVMLRAQLDRYLGRLERPTREALAVLYRATLSQTTPHMTVPTGLPLTGPDDVRAQARIARSDELRPLFAAASQLLGSEEEAEETLGTILAVILTTDKWDRPSLLSSASVEGTVLDRMLRDDLDLTDQSDLGDVGRMINVVQLDDWRDPVRRSLRRSRGGIRQAKGDTPQYLAARSFSGVPEAERQRDLTRDQSTIDDSPEAREHAIEDYIRCLEKELDDA